VYIIGKSIISHHSLNLTKVNSYKVSNEAISDLKICSKKYFENQDLIKDSDYSNLNLEVSAGGEITNLSDFTRIKTTDDYLFYFVLVRLLRLADQEATKKLNQS
jgi:CRISPR-associated endonuclease/helicase Cas3